MDRDTWKRTVQDRLRGLARDIRTFGPGMLYGALCGSALFPMIQASKAAMAQGDMGKMYAIGGLLSGLGVNLLAGEIQKWRDRSEAELAAELEERATREPELRAQLDTVLCESEAPRVVQAILAEADRDWFVDALRAELKRVDSGLTIEVDNQGLLVVGQRNLGIAGSMIGSIAATGDYTTIVVGDSAVRALAHHLTPKRMTPEETVKVTRRYLELLLGRYRYLDFRGMGMGDRVALQLPLREMYVPLKARVEMPRGETWARELMVAGRRAGEEEAAAMGERMSEPQPLLDLLARHDGLIILGDPGAGKTTFLKYLSVRLAAGEGAALGLGDRLPILVPLSAYANALAAGDIALQEFLGQYYHNLGIRLPVEELLESALDSGQALLMLDGLDEVQALERRTTVVDRVEQFFAYHRQAGNKFLLTSRIVGYREVRPAAAGLVECTLVDFDDGDIADFVEKWTQALERAIKGESEAAHAEAATEKEELLFAVQHNPGVRQLAANPLLLTILALMKRQGVALPERRVQLYDKYVETLLRHWNLARGLDRRPSRELDVLETLRVLAPLALWMHETSPGVGLVKQQQMRRTLVEIYRRRHAEDPERAAQQLLEDAREYASLLLERGSGQYGFIHLTFQEYLAAVAIGQMGQSDVAPVAEMLAAHVDDDTWHEVALLTVGYLGIVQQRDQAAGEVLLKLLTSRAGAPGAAAALAGEAVADAWPGGVTAQCREGVVEALLATIVDDAAAAPKMRARAGSALGALGDPRDLDAMAPVPGGPFTMGGADSDEKPVHTVKVPDFRIGKYPVTNQQYAAFVAATRHEAPRHWQGRTPPPELRNHPVVYVSWRDAVAYCRWLSDQQGEEVRLPSEAEWEKAARGDKDRRAYPWGDEEPDENLCNFAMRIGTTTPVGIYPAGASAYGCLDMSGSVWEWTRSLYVKYPYAADDGREDARATGSRVLRGGAFRGNRSSVRCAYRSGRESRQP